MTLAVTLARPEDADTVIDLLEDAARWLLARGVDQWHPGQWKREKVNRAIAEREVFLAHEAGDLVGTITLQWADTSLWPDDGASGYVHRLAVHDASHGRGIGRDLLAWAEREVAARGRFLLRLDCACANSRLRRYYEQLGFTCRGDRHLGPFCASLFEKRIV